METKMIIDELLERLKSAVLSSRFSRRKVLSSIEALLSWLAEPENNTDSNCREVDSYVAYEILPEINTKEIPEDIRAILFDMGATLHDTHTSPEIAENFESTPTQLLERVRSLKLER